MNIAIWLIFGWLIGEFFHMTLWEWFKSKFNLDNKKVKTLLVFIGIALLIAVIGSGFYRVSTSENIILTKITGNKIVKDIPGIKYSLLSSRESINIQKQLMKFPQDYSSSGYEIITSDEKPILINSFLEYRIKNVYKWGIENKDSQQKLLVSFASTVKNEIQRRSYDSVRNILDEIEKEITEDISGLEERYGIEIISVDIQISDTASVKKAKSESESQKINSESLIQSYQSEALALQEKYKSLEDKEFIKYMEFMKAMKDGEIEVIMIPSGSIPSFDLLN